MHAFESCRQRYNSFKRSNVGLIGWCFRVVLLLSDFRISFWYIMYARFPRRINPEHSYIHRSRIGNNCNNYSNYLKVKYRTE